MKSAFHWIHWIVVLFASSAVITGVAKSYLLAVTQGLLTTCLSITGMHLLSQQSKAH